MILESYYKLIDKLGFWGKPLGTCVYCQSVWLVIIWQVINWQSWVELIAGIGLNYFFLVIINKIDD